MSHPHLPYWLATLYFPKIGPRTVLQWLTHFPTIQALFHASDEEKRSKGMREDHIALFKLNISQHLEFDLTWQQQKDHHHILCLDDEDYPDLLKNIHDPPVILFVLGDKAALKKMQIAIVGSRHATATGLKNASTFATALVKAGMAITSGLALGIDGACHRSAMAAGGTTIGVAGTGLNCLYPRAHWALMTEMLQNQGAVVSEFPLAAEPHPSHFPRRNRVISGLSVGALVVEAALKSGSLITARHALEQGREVFAIPGSIHNPLARGCHHLLRQGATLVETVDDILNELTGFDGWSGSHHSGQSKPQSSSSRPLVSKAAFGLQAQDNALPQLHRQVLEQIEYEITQVDMILLRSGLTPGELSSILLSLELNGYIQSMFGGYVRINP